MLLSVRDLKLAADKSDRERAAKLTGRFIGPLRVTRVINPNSYELALPEQLHIWPVQNISKLRHYIRSPDRFAGRPQPVSRPPPEAADASGDGLYVVERILAKRMSGRRQMYLVQWQGYPIEESSWEPKSGLRCPELLVEFEARELEPEDEAIGIAALALCQAEHGQQYAIKSGKESNQDRT